MICAKKNQGQNVKNVFSQVKGWGGCCGENFAPCRRTFTLATTENAITLTVTEDGVDRVVSLPSDITTDNAVILRQQISKALLATGGYMECASEYFRGVEVTKVGSVVTVVITGTIVVKNIIYSDGTVNPTVLCTEQSRCTFFIDDFTGGSANTLRVNGTDKSLGTITPGVTSAATVKTAIEGALTSPTVAGTVAVQVVDGGYDIQISASNSQNVFRLNGTPLGKRDCALTFIAP